MDNFTTAFNNSLIEPEYRRAFDEYEFCEVCFNECLIECLDENGVCGVCHEEN